MTSFLMSFTQNTCLLYVHYTPIFFNGLLTILLHKQFGSTFKSLEYEKIVNTISHQNSLKYFTKRCLSIFVVKLSLIFLYMKKPKLGNFVLRSGSGPHEKWDCAKKVGIRILVFKSHSQITLKKTKQLGHNSPIREILQIILQ